MSAPPAPLRAVDALLATLLAWGGTWAAQLGLGWAGQGGQLRAGTWLLERTVAGAPLVLRVNADPTLVEIRHIAYVPDLNDPVPPLLGWGAFGVLVGALVFGLLPAALAVLAPARRGLGALAVALPLALVSGWVGARVGLGWPEALLGLLSGALAGALWGAAPRAGRGLGVLAAGLLGVLAADREVPPPSSPAPLTWSTPGVPAGTQPKRVILITVDTLRADHVSAFGYPRPTTPALDQLARTEAQIFTRAYSAAPWTLPSVTATFTSLTPPVHTVEDQNRRLAPGVPTIASSFAAAGWHTAAFVTHIYVTSLFGLDQGFEEFHELSIDWDYVWGKQLRADALNAEVLPWLAEHREEPFFLYLHYFDPHWDYDPPAPWDRSFTDPGYAGPATGTWDFLRQYLSTNRAMPPEDLQRVIDLYDGEIRYTDHHLGALFDALRQLGMWEDTLLVLSSDHGEEFKEHGRMHHILTLYEEVLHVPLLVKPAGGRPEGAPLRIPTRVRNLDIAPTLLELAGLPIPSTFEGQSLTGLLRGEPGEDRRVYARSLRHQVDVVGLLDGPWKYIRRYARGLQEEELFHLGEDPGERTNRAALAPEVLAEQRRHLERWLVELRALRQSSPPGAPAVELSAEQLERLRALGYAE